MIVNSLLLALKFFLFLLFLPKRLWACQIFNAYPNCEDGVYNNRLAILRDMSIFCSIFAYSTCILNLLFQMFVVVLFLALKEIEGRCCTKVLWLVGKKAVVLKRRVRSSVQSFDLGIRSSITIFFASGLTLLVVVPASVARFATRLVVFVLVLALTTLQTSTFI